MAAWQDGLDVCHMVAIVCPLLLGVKPSPSSHPNEDTKGSDRLVCSSACVLLMEGACGSRCTAMRKTCSNEAHASQ